MRRLVLLAFVVFVVFVAVLRQRLFLRDPLGKVFENETRVLGAQVFINYSNDVLTMTDAPAAPVMVQAWDRSPGNPKDLLCLRRIACFTPEDRAPKYSLAGKTTSPVATMTNREVSYRAPGGVAVRVVLR